MCAHDLHDFAKESTHFSYAELRADYKDEVNKLLLAELPEPTTPLAKILPPATTTDNAG
jgi:hypothetical protein